MVGWPRIPSLRIGFLATRSGGAAVGGFVCHSHAADAASSGAAAEAACPPRVSPLLRVLVAVVATPVRRCHKPSSSPPPVGTAAAADGAASSHGHIFSKRKRCTTPGRPPGFDSQRFVTPKKVEAPPRSCWLRCCRPWW